MRARGGEPAVIAVSGGEIQSWSYDDIAVKALSLASGLIADGIKPQEPIAIWAPNSAELVIAHLAISACGALPVPIDDLSTGSEAWRFMINAGCRRIFTAAAHLTALRAGEEGVDLDIILLDPESGPDRASDAMRPWIDLIAAEPGPLPDISDTAPVLLIYTSGTTGAPKAFTLSKANLAANLDALRVEKIVDPGDRVLLPLPLHHVYPIMSMHLALASGACLVFPEAVGGPQIVEALQLAQVKAIVGVPRLYEALVEGLENRLTAIGRPAVLIFRGLQKAVIALQRRTGLRLGPFLFRPLTGKMAPDLKMLFSGGAKLSSGVIWKLEGLGWRVHNGYGLAETASVFTGNLPRATKIGSDGKPFVAGSKMRIDKPDEDGIGEIHLRGPSVFSGYRSPKDANTDAFTKDGWFRTGDLGRLDDDGYLDVTGRIKELIVLGGGENIYPEILEKIYGEHPSISEIALFENDGNLAALILPDFDAVRKTTNASFRDTIRVALSETTRQLPSFQRLTGFALVRAPLPRTRLGKFQRFKMPKLYAQALAGQTTAPARPLSAEDRALLNRGAAAQVWQIIKDRFPDRQLSLDDNPELDLGMDSLSWVSLGLELQSKFGLVLSEPDFAGVIELRDLIKIAGDTTIQPGGQHDIASEPDLDQRKWLAPAGPVAGFFGSGLHWLNTAVMALVFRLEVKGLEHVPQNGPCVLAANHASDMDPAALAGALPHRIARQLRWSGDTGRLFSGPVRRAFCRIARIFPVDERRPLAAIKMAELSLAQDDILVWFPESWRSPDGKLQRFQTGIGMLLENTDVPVIPVWIEGTFDAFPRHRRLPRPHKTSVCFGPPVTATDLEKQGAGATSQIRITQALHRHVAKLAPGAQPQPDR